MPWRGGSGMVGKRGTETALHHFVDKVLFTGSGKSLLLLSISMFCSKAVSSYRCLHCLLRCSPLRGRRCVCEHDSNGEKKDGHPFKDYHKRPLTDLEGHRSRWWHVIKSHQQRVWEACTWPHKFFRIVTRSSGKNVLSYVTGSHSLGWE